MERQIVIAHFFHKNFDYYFEERMRYLKKDRKDLYLKTIVHPIHTILEQSFFLPTKISSEQKQHPFNLNSIRFKRFEPPPSVNFVKKKKKKRKYN